MKTLEFIVTTALGRVILCGLFFAALWILKLIGE